MSYNDPPYYISAYSLAKKRGFAGSLDDWLNSLVGPQGPQGKTAYEYAVAGGFEGSEEEFAVKMAKEAAMIANAENMNKHMLNIQNPHGVTAKQAGALPLSGGAMQGDVIMGGHKMTGLGEPSADGDAVPLGYANQNFAPAVESADYPGCYYRTVNGVVEWINPPMVVGVEYRTAERCDGKVVYARYIDCGAASPGTAIAVYPSIGKPIRWSGRTEHGVALPFQPYVTDRSMDITIGVQENTIFISAGSQQTAAKIYVSVWYVKD